MIVAFTSVSVHVTLSGSTMNGDTPVANEFVNFAVADALPGMIGSPAPEWPAGILAAPTDDAGVAVAWPTGEAQASTTMTIRVVTTRPVVPSTARRIGGVTTFNT